MKQKMLVLLVSGLCTLCACHSRQYHLVKIKKSWTEAQSYCRENYIDLATIDNEQEMEALMGVVGSSYYDSAWIGLYDDINNWKWSDKGFYNEGEIEFWNWDIKQPDTYEGKEHCVEMLKDGKWNDRPCSDMFPFICYDENLPQRYILIKEQKTWREAQSYCRQNHADLASVRNQTENNEVQEAAKEAGERVWIGLFRESWRWSDQSNSSYRNWNETQPDNRRGNESCAEADFGLSGTWNDLECKSKKFFFCSAVRKRFVMTVELNTTSDMNIKDTVVSEAILQQIQQNLEEQGIPVQKLNWRKQPDGETFQRKAEDEEKKEGCEKSEV